MAKTNTFDVTTPAGGDDPTQGDDRIREIKAGIQERMDSDHYWKQVGNIVDEDDVGFHRKVTLLVQATPSVKANAGILYSKDVSAKAELHYFDEDSNEVQLTSVGAAASSFIAGDIIFSTVVTAHSGWTNVSATYSNKFIRINATPLTTGGADTHNHGAVTGSHTLVASEIPAHTHTYDRASGVGSGGSESSGGTVLSTSTGSIGGGGGHTHTLTSVDNIPAYVQLVMFQKN